MGRGKKSFTPTHIFVTFPYGGRHLQLARGKVDSSVKQFEFTNSRLVIVTMLQALPTFSLFLLSSGMEGDISFQDNQNYESKQARTSIYKIDQFCRLQRKL